MVTELENYKYGGYRPKTLASVSYPLESDQTPIPVIIFVIYTPTSD